MDLLHKSSGPPNGAGSVSSGPPPQSISPAPLLSSHVTAGASSAATSSVGVLSSGAPYPGLLEQMRAPAWAAGRERRGRARALASGSWKQILSHVVESTRAGGGGAAMPAPSGRRGGTNAVGTVAATLDSARRGVVPGAPLGSPYAIIDEVYGLGGGYNPLAKHERARARPVNVGPVGPGGNTGGVGGAGSSGARLVREPDTENWAHWTAEEWKAWKESRARERERNSKADKEASRFAAGLPRSDVGAGLASLLGGAALSAKHGRRNSTGSEERSGSALDAFSDDAVLTGASPTSKKRGPADDLAANMADLAIDLNPLDHIRTIRHTAGPTHTESGAEDGSGMDGSAVGAVDGGSLIGGGHTGKRALAKRQQLARARAADAKFQHEQKERAAELYRNIWQQQMKIVQSNKALQHYSDAWDTKLQAYKATLERDAQGNRIRAWHQMDAAERAAVIAEQNGLLPAAQTFLKHTGSGNGSGSSGPQEEKAAHASTKSSKSGNTGAEGNGSNGGAAAGTVTGGATGGAADSGSDSEGDDGNGGAGGGNSSDEADDSTNVGAGGSAVTATLSHTASGGAHTHGGGHGGNAGDSALGGRSSVGGGSTRRRHAHGPNGNPSYPAQIRKLQASNPHKHIYHSATAAGVVGSLSARGVAGSPAILTAGTRLHNGIAELAATGAVPLGSLSARAHASLAAAQASAFESMLSSGLGAAQAAQAQMQMAAAAAQASGLSRGVGGSGPNAAIAAAAAGLLHRSTLFHRCALSLKNRKALLAVEERLERELKEVFEAVVREGASLSGSGSSHASHISAGSKLTKSAFKMVLINNFAAAGVAPLASIHAAAVAAGPPGSKEHATAAAQASPPVYIDRVRLDPMLDRLWMAFNSNARSVGPASDRAGGNANAGGSNSLASSMDLSDFSQMLLLSLAGSVEDRSSVCFELLDLDEDGVLDLHDFFLCLHMGLDGLFPRDVGGLAEALHCKLEEQERAGRRRQEKVVAAARREKQHTEMNNNNKAKLQQRQQQLVVGGASSTSSSPTNADVAHSHASSTTSFFPDLSPSSLPTAEDASALNEPLPGPCHITKAEFVRLHTSPSSSNSLSNTVQLDHRPSSSGGAPHLNPLIRTLSSLHSSVGGAGGTAQQAHASTVDLLEMVTKAFYLPYRKATAKEGAQAAREREKERAMAAAATATTLGNAPALLGKVAEESKSNTAGAPGALTMQSASGGRLARGERRSLHSMDELKAMSTMVLAAQTQQAQAAQGVVASVTNDVDLLLNRIRLAAASPASSVGGGRLSRGIFRKLLLLYFQGGSNHTFHAGNPAATAWDLAEEERVIDFLFHALDVSRVGSLDPNYTAAMLGFALRSDATPLDQIRFFHRLLDLDRDGVVSARDLCMAHDITQSYTLRTDLKVLLDVFMNKITGVLAHTRASGAMVASGNGASGGGAVGFGGAMGRSTANETMDSPALRALLAQPGYRLNGRDVLPDPKAPSAAAVAAEEDAAIPASPKSKRSGSSLGGRAGSDPATAAERLPLFDGRVNGSSGAGNSSNPGSSALVGITLEEASNALQKINPSFFLKMLRRVPYQREKKTFQAATLRHHHQINARRIKGGDHQVGDHHGTSEGVAGAASGGSGATTEEILALHRSLMRDLRVSTQVDFLSKFPDAHNAVIGEQIDTLRRSLDFQHDCAGHTRVFYLAVHFLKAATSNSATSHSGGNVLSASSSSSSIVGGPSSSAPPTAAASLEHAYSLLVRLLTRVPQVYVQWTLLQDGSKHTSMETSKFRKAAARYGLVSKEERRRAKYKCVATPALIFAYGGFPRPKNASDLDRAELQHYGTPIRAIMLSVSGAQLNEEGLDDLDFIRMDPATGEKYLDQPLYFLELLAQTHMWLTAFGEMVELENQRLMAPVAGSKGASAAAAAVAAAATNTSTKVVLGKSGLLRVVRIGAGNFAAVPGMAEHQGSLIAYLLMQAFIINLKRNSVVTTQQQPSPPIQPIPQQPTGPKGSQQGKHRNHVPSFSSATPSPTSQQQQQQSVPVISSLYKGLSVLEFIFFDEDCCPVPFSPCPPPPGAGSLEPVMKRMVGGVELRFSRRDVLELTTAQTMSHHVGILAPADSFALPGNEEGYTSLAAMMGNNTSLRLHQGFHFNPHLLAQANYVPVELAPELIPQGGANPAAAAAAAEVLATTPAAAAAAAELWGLMLPVLASDSSPSPWALPPEAQRTLSGALEEGEEGDEEGDTTRNSVSSEDELLTLRTDD